MNSKMRDLETSDIVEAYCTAIKVTSEISESQEKFPQMHKFTLAVKKMFLSHQPSKVYALIYRE